MATFAIIGAGPAGLMAADVLSGAGHAVTLYDAMPTVGRKFLMAGKSGLNLTHAEPHGQLVSRYGEASARLRPALDAFPATDIRNWCEGLGIETFVGSSGRVFPTAMKASPLLRALLARLGARGATIAPRHRWLGWEAGRPVFDTPSGRIAPEVDAVLLALGGASWPRLGSDAAWVPWLAEKGIAIAPFRPANCGFAVPWSPYFAERFTGAPVKAVRATSDAGTLRGEFVTTARGIEGGLVYAHSSALRDRLARDGAASLTFDLVPDHTAARLAETLGRLPASVSFANRLRKGARIEGVKAALVRECLPEAARLAPDALAAALKALPLSVAAPSPIAEAISSAGGVVWDEVGVDYQLRKLPGVFLAGEMLDWEAPTGGYLLTACFATGRAAARGMLERAARTRSASGPPPTP